MDNTYWLRQQRSKPLFPDLLWSRPENKVQAGKLLIIGGSSSGFSSVAEAFHVAQTVGIGTIRVILPFSLERTVMHIFPEAEFANSNMSGGFSNNSIDTIINATDWADGVLLTGDLGKNSETQIVIETFLKKYNGKLCLVNDSIDFFLNQPGQLLNRDHTLLATNASQLRKIATYKGVSIISSLPLMQQIDRLHELSLQSEASIVTSINQQTIVAHHGQISSTEVNPELEPTIMATRAIVWLIQNPAKPFEAITTSLAN